LGSAFDPTHPAGSCYGLVFDDEFNGTSLDTTKWFTERPYGLAPLASQYISVQNGYLTISGDGGYNWGIATVGPGMQGFVANGGAYFEARWQFNQATSGNGGWPSFWSTNAQSAYGTVPAYALEVDWEYFGTVFGGPGNESAGGIHDWSPAGQVAGQGFSTTLNDDGQWHVNSFLWIPGQAITWYVDGQSIGTLPIQAGGTYDGVSGPDQFMPVILGTATGWPVNFDYVHVWQLPAAATADGHAIITP
jgi:hypothetical protein